MATTQNHQLQDINRQPTSNSPKIFIQRDYSEGTNVRFQTKFPPELDGKIEKTAFEHMINTLNSIYSDAETISSTTYCEGCLACLTAYLAYICMESHYEKCLKRVAKFIQDQNETVWVPRGLLVTDPADRGLRVIEVTVLNEANRS